MQTIESYILELKKVLDEMNLAEIEKIIEILSRAYKNDKSVFIIGNGGSASTASHFASDLSKGAICQGKPRIRAYALTDNMPLLSAWANDTAYENIFAEQLENSVEPGDVVIGISGSGDSPSVLNGVKVGKAKGATAIGFIGFDGGKLKDLVNIAVVVPNYNMEQVEDIHLLLEHIITTCLRGGLKRIS